MSPSVTLATKNEGECHQVPHLPRQTMSACATPATPSVGRCLQVPRLPRKTKVNVTKCHACHAKWRGAPGDQRRPMETNGDQRRPRALPSATCTPPGTQDEGRCRQVPRLPREMTVDVTKCYTCHIK